MSPEFIYWLLELAGTLQNSENKRQRRKLYASIYLHVIPSLSPVYPWSFDPPLEPKMCKYLGLPFKLKLKITHWQESWPTKIYEIIRDYQIARGYDPRTTDFARFLHFPIFNIVPAENSRFKFQRVKEVPVYTRKPAIKSEKYFGPRDGRQCTSNDLSSIFSGDRGDG
ncbi:hypothetical protein L218DRAFT_957266 [Marasmius fiardii PR-910]|nr:hypothetical protein L218DRAFT_957266 [Marasmius fiardii PR-910]